MSQLKGTMWHAVVGSAVGVGVATASSFASSALISAARPSLSQNATGRAVVEGVISGTTAAVMLLVGEVALTRFERTEDPLFRSFYYNVVFHNTNTVFGFSRAMAALFNSIPYSPSPPISKQPGGKCGDCTATGKSCDGCGGH